MNDEINEHADSNDEVLQRELEVLTQYGIYARVAASIVRTSVKFDAVVELELNDEIVSGRDIMGLITLEASCGSKIMATAKGKEAEELLDALEDLFARKFDME